MPTNKDIVISDKKFTTPAYIAGEEKPRHGAVILIHEVWGLTPHIRNITDRLAAEGYLVIAPDLISHTGITKKIDQSIMAQAADPKTRDEAQKKMREAMAPIRSPEFGKETIERLKVVYAYLKSEFGAEKIAVIGFCFGGTYSYALAASGVKLLAALPFYGHPPENESDLQKIACPVYAFYGEQDTALVEGLPKLAATMKKLGKDFKYKVYPNTGHAFMNDSNPARYNEAAAKDAWKESLRFLTDSMRQSSMQ